MAAPLDLRSDTVTRPSPAMRRAMAEAEVGDDVYGEDPTVNRLQDLAARKLGKEAALFVPSGSMANLVALLVHTGRQGEAICEAECHSYVYEQGGAASVAGVQMRPLAGKAGVLTAEQVRAALRGDDAHEPRTSLVMLENTHNRHGGAPLTRDQTRAVAEVAHERGIPLHVDGARIFNAAVALRTPASELVRDADSVSFCLSKGLGCPVGSLVCGSRAFIAEAHRARKLLGGGMRQAGVLAAPGILALDTMVDRLALDHENAALFAEAVQRAGLRLVHPVRTNIVVFEAPRAPELVASLRKEGVLLALRNDGFLRAVTHCDVDRGQAEEAGKAFVRLAKAA